MITLRKRSSLFYRIAIGTFALVVLGLTVFTSDPGAQADAEPQTADTGIESEH